MPGFFDDFEREINNFFKLSFSNFNRPVKDMQPFQYQKTESGFAIAINTLGISKNDISVEVKTKKGDPYRYLHVSGKTKMEKFNFENNVNMAIRLLIDEEIEEVVYEVKDGLTIVYLKLKSESLPELKARLIQDEQELGF
jgi:HSP20 family molecular chaperone IbpA